MLYLLFTEGYFSSSDVNNAIRRELCNEAIRLAKLLAEHPAGQVPETFALLALMHFHTSRMPARQDSAGGLLLLKYGGDRRTSRLRILETVVDPREAIKMFFDSLVKATLNDPDKKGCLLFNTALECSSHDDDVKQLVSEGIAQPAQ